MCVCVCVCVCVCFLIRPNSPLPLLPIAFCIEQNLARTSRDAELRAFVSKYQQRSEDMSESAA